MKYYTHNAAYQEKIDQLCVMREQRQLDKLDQLAKKLFEQADKEQELQVKMFSLYCLAEVALLRQDISECFSLCWELIEYFEVHERDLIYILTCNLLGTCYSFQEDVHNAISYFIKGYQYTEIIHTKELKYKILTNIGTTFFDIDCYEQALFYYMECFFEVSKDSISNEVYEGILVNILVTYTRMKDYQNAIAWEQRYQDVLKEPKNIMGELGVLVYKIAKYAHFQQIDKVKEYTNQLLIVSKEAWTGMFSIKLLLEVMLTCLEIQEYDILMDCVQLLKEHVSKDDYKTWMSVSSICIQMYQQQKKKELYYHELEMYYQYYHMAAAYDRQMEYMNLKNIILLEEERAVSNQLLRQHVELSKKSECDSFTGLLNKTACISKINTYIQEKGIEEVAVFFIVDVDNFKNINDTYGHLFGDVVLKEIANILRKYIRTSDIIGRIGGDEFCFLLKNVKNMDRIYLKLDKIMEDIQKIKLKEMKQGITISMGGIQLVKHLIYEDILRKADQALYEAKRKGKNTYVLLENY